MTMKKSNVRIQTTDSAAKSTKEEPKSPTDNVSKLPIDNALFTADDAAGYYEGMDQGAYSVPFLGILQALSPAVQRNTPGFIEGAAAGMIFNNVTKAIADRVQVVPLRRSHSLCWWVPRDKGGGFIREEEATPENMAWFAAIPPDDKKRRLVKEGEVQLEVTEHRSFWVCLVNDNKREPAMISMAKSQLKVARDWNTNIDVSAVKIDVPMGTGQTAKRPILHSCVWELGTTLRTKDGNNWYVWTVRFVRQIIDPLKDRLLAQEVKEKVEIAKSMTNVQRQLEQIQEPAEATGEM